jgi:hypothetical protein
MRKMTEQWLRTEEILSIMVIYSVTDYGLKKKERKRE